MTGGMKRHGQQMCDSCGREFEARRDEWDCPYCGFDNRIGVERAHHAARIGTARSVEESRKQRQQQGESES